MRLDKECESLTGNLCHSEEVRSVPDKLADFKANKRYLQATELLKNSGKMPNTTTTQSSGVSVCL